MKSKEIGVAILTKMCLGIFILLCMCTFRPDFQRTSSRHKHNLHIPLFRHFAVTTDRQKFLSKIAVQWIRRRKHTHTQRSQEDRIFS